MRFDDLHFLVLFIIVTLLCTERWCLDVLVSLKMAEFTLHSAFYCIKKVPRLAYTDNHVSLTKTQ